MAILQLTIRDFGKIEVAKIKPTGEMILLSGKNGAGKSTVLNSIEAVLTGKKIERAITKGKEKAEIEILTEDFRIIGKWRVDKNGEEKTNLDVYSADGEASYKSPRALLEKIYGKVSLDPSSFFLLGKTAAGRREQREILLKMAKIDFTAIEDEKEKIYAQRTLKNERAKYFSSILKGMEEPDPDLPEKEIDLSEGFRALDVVEKKEKKYKAYLEEADGIEGDIKEAETSIDKEDERILQAKEQIRQAQEEIDRAEGAIELYKTELQELRTQRGNLLAPEEVTDEMRAIARSEMSLIQTKNKEIIAGQEYRKNLLLWEEADQAAQNMTDKLDSLAKKKVKLLKDAKFPVKGLSVDDEQILVKGLPLSKLSQGEGILFAATLGMAMSPKAKVLLFRNASFLDSAGLKEIETLAKKKGFQVWVERVAEEAGEVGVHFEEGRIIEGTKRREGG